MPGPGPIGQQEMTAEDPRFTRHPGTHVFGVAGTAGGKSPPELRGPRPWLAVLPAPVPLGWFLPIRSLELPSEQR